VRKRYGGIGFPLLEASAVFRVPSRPQDLLAIATTLGTLRRKTLELHHAFSRDGIALLRARELRVWAQDDATRPNGLRAATIPAEIVRGLTAPPDDG
jgi:acyl-CoA thioesterase FadM